MPLRFFGHLADSFQRRNKPSLSLLDAEGKAVIAWTGGQAMETLTNAFIAVVANRCEGRAYLGQC
jgi:hypothetical protein